MRPSLPLGLSLAGLAPRDADTAPDPRAQIEWAADQGFRAVQLDVTVGGLRPRELDRSARRDLAALLRRRELGLHGVDLWIPATHLVDPAHADRAVSAVVQAVEMAAELAGLVGSSAAAVGGAAQGPVVSLSLPADIAADVSGQLSQAASRHGVLIADHAWPPRPAAAESAIGVGIDPASVIFAGLDPAQEAGRVKATLASARLSDLSPAGRVPPGEGALDEMAYIVALEVAGYRREVVLDVRNLPRPRRAAREVLERWTGLGV